MERESKKPALVSWRDLAYSLDKLTLFVSGLFTGSVPVYSVVCAVSKSIHKKTNEFSFGSG